MYSFTNKWAKYFKNSLLPKNDVTFKITEKEADKAYYGFFNKERTDSKYFEKEFTDSKFEVFWTPQGWFFKIKIK